MEEQAVLRSEQEADSLGRLPPVLADMRGQVAAWQRFYATRGLRFKVDARLENKFIYTDEFAVNRPEPVERGRAKTRMQVWGAVGKCLLEHKNEAPIILTAEADQPTEILKAAREYVLLVWICKVLPKDIDLAIPQ